MKSAETSPLPIAANTIWNTVGALFYFGCQWLITIFVVVLSPDYQNAGALAFSMATANIFASIALNRIRVIQVSDICNVHSGQNYVCFRFLTIFVGWVIAIIYSALIAKNLALMITLICYLLFKSDEVFSDVLYGIDQKNKRMDYIGKSQLIRGCLSLSSFVVLIYFTQNLNLAVIGMFATCVLVTILFDIPHAKRFGKIKPLFNTESVQTLARSSLLTTTITLSIAAIVAIPRQLFGVSFGEEALGIYAAIATPTVLIQATSALLYTPMIGVIGEKWVNEDFQGLKKAISKISLLLFLVVLVFILVLSIFGPPLLALVYGDSITAYLHLLIPTLICTALIGFAGYFVDILIILRKIPIAAISTVVGLICCLLVTRVFLNLAGMDGINYSTICACGLAIAISAAIIVKEVYLRKI